MKIYLISEGTTAIIPIVPNGIEISVSKEAISKDTVKGQIYLKGKLASKTLEWDSFFPVNKHYSYVNNGSWSDGNRYVSFINKIREEDKECRCICLSESGESLMNALVDITEFSYTYDRTNDITYSIKVVELKR